MATGYLGRARGTQNAEQLHHTFSNIFLRGKLREEVRFVCKQETGGILQPNELSLGKTGVMDETVASVLAGKNPPPPPPPRSTLEAYNEMSIFISVDNTENVVKSVVQKILGSSGPGGTDSESLQGWILKLGEDRNKLCTSVENFVNWLDNKSLLWSAYREFMSGCLIALDKKPYVRSVGVRETSRHHFSKCVLKVT